MIEKTCKNAYDPLSHGRWYRFFVESGEEVTITQGDLTVQISGQYMKLPENFHIIDTKYDINSVSGGEAASIVTGCRIYADGRQAVALPARDNFDFAYIFVFGYFA